MTTTILCAGALALPGGSDDDARRTLLAHHAPREDGATARLLARARAPKLRSDDALVPRELPDEAWLRARFEPADGDAIAAFAMRAGGESPRLLVRPVHLQVGLDTLVLSLPERIGADEAQALAETANRQFADDGLSWSPETPHAWTLQATNDGGRARIGAWAKLHCRSARMVAGRRIDAWQPEGEAARSWRALVNELQMLWHEHPVNDARSQAGRPALNSVWLEGSCSRAGRRGFDAVITSDDALAGLALSAGCEVSAVPGEATPDDFLRFAAIQEDVGTLLLDPGWWRIAVADGDAEAWQRAWDRLDTLIERLAGAGDPPETLVLGGERDLLEFRRRPSDLWALWRNRRLAELLATHR